MTGSLRVTWASGETTFPAHRRVRVGSGAHCEVRIDSVPSDEAVLIEPGANGWSVRVRPGASVLTSDGAELSSGSPLDIDGPLNLLVEGEQVSLVPTSLDSGQEPNPEPSHQRDKPTTQLHVTTDAGARNLEPGSYSVGRLADADLRVDASDVGRQHATVAFRAGVWSFEDHSQNGSYIAGQRVTTATPLYGRVEVQLGSANGQSIVFQSQTNEPQAPSSASTFSTAGPGVSHERLELAADRSQLTLTPGPDESVEFLVEAQNHHPADVLTVGLSVTSVDGDPSWITFLPTDGLEPGQVHLAQHGGTAQVTCRVSVPREPTSRPGIYNFRIQAIEGGGAPKAVNMSVRVLPFVDLQVERPPRMRTTARGNQAGERTLSFLNQSNVPLEVRLPDMDDKERLLVRSGAQSFELREGQRTRAELALSLLEKPSLFARSEFDYRLTGEVSSQTPEKGSWGFEGVFLRRPVLPLWVLIALPVLLALYLPVAIASGLPPFSEEEDVRMPAQLADQPVEAAIAAIATSVPCSIPVHGHTGSELSCSIRIIDDPRADKPEGVVTNTSPASGVIFEDRNNIAIDLSVAVPLEPVPKIGSYVSLSLERALELIKLNLVDASEYNIDSGNLFISVNHPETPIDRAPIGSGYPCGQLCEAEVTSQIPAAGAELDDSTDIDITLQVTLQTAKNLSATVEAQNTAATVEAEQASASATTEALQTNAEATAEAETASANASATVDAQVTATAVAESAQAARVDLVFYGELGTGNDGKLQIWKLDENYELDTLIGEGDYRNWRSVGGLTLPDGSSALVFYGELGTGNDGKLQIWKLDENHELDTLIGEGDYRNWRSVGGLTLPDGSSALVFYGELGTGNDGKLQIWKLDENHELDTLIGEGDYRNWRSVGGLTLPDGSSALVFYGELGTGNDGKLQIWKLDENHELDTLIGEGDYRNWRSVGGF